MKAKERHDIKTDKFLEFMVRVEDFIVDNAKSIGLVALAVVIVVAAWVSITMFIDSRENSASVEINDLLPEIVTFQNAAAVDAEKGAELVEDLNKVIADNGGTSGSMFAEYYLGVVHLKSGDTEKAESIFRSVSETRHPVVSTLAAAKLGDMLFEQKKYDQSAEIFAKLSNENSGSLPLSYLAWKAGICYEKLEDKNQALLYFNKAKDSESLGLESTLVDRIERKIMELTTE